MKHFSMFSKKRKILKGLIKSLKNTDINQYSNYFIYLFIIMEKNKIKFISRIKNEILDFIKENSIDIAYTMNNNDIRFLLKSIRKLSILKYVKIDDF